MCGQKVCFVVMGFGKKNAYTKEHKLRVLDLDATYRSIIEPAARDAGLRCIRADKMLNSGMIDKRMFEMLLRADLVIADISTGNVNAVYELGVRHALRKFSTIIMQEQDADFYFDLSHISTFRYKHLGEDIGHNEATCKKQELQELIEKLISEPREDSPVYDFLNQLQPPIMSEDTFENFLTDIEEETDRFTKYISEGKQAIRNDDFLSAISHFSKALKMMETSRNGDNIVVGKSEMDFVIQQLALATYKSETPSQIEALKSGLDIINKLSPDVSNNLETIGIAGAIYKRLYDLDGRVDNLDKAIELYGRGFNLQRDYYNGENYALCLEKRAEVTKSNAEAFYNKITAHKVRSEILKNIKADMKSDNYEDRPDKVWMNATMANTLFAMGHDEDATKYEELFYKGAKSNRERETYQINKKQMLDFREKNSIDYFKKLEIDNPKDNSKL